MKRIIGLVISVALVVGSAFAEPDADAVLDQARSEYQESVAEEPGDNDTIYRYERQTSETESWSMQSTTEPEWWTEGADREEEPEANASSQASAPQAPSPRAQAPQGATRSGEPQVSGGATPKAETGGTLRDFRPAPITRRRVDRETVAFVPVHVSIFGESWGRPVSTNLAVSPLISSVHTVNGIQAAGVIAAVADEVRGVQVAGVVAAGEGDVEGLQGAGVFVSAEGNVRGIQTAGVFSVAEQDVHGIQASGVFNAAEGTVNGVQAAGVFNTAGDVAGGQFGIVNVAEDVRGVQVGLVNISDTMYGLPIGLINIVRNGIRNVTVWFEDSGYNYVGYQYGSNIFYTIAYGGLTEDDWFESYDSLVTGLGLGMRVQMGALFVDADVSAKHVAAGDPDGRKIADVFAYDATTYPAARLTAGIRLGRRLAFFGGASFDVHLPGVTERGAFHAGRMIPVSEEGFSAELYPKYFVGFSL